MVLHLEQGWFLGPFGHPHVHVQGAMMYGTIPIVHATGGLKDSVKSWYSEKESSTGAVEKPMGWDDGNHLLTTIETGENLWKIYGKSMEI